MRPFRTALVVITALMLLIGVHHAQAQAVEPYLELQLSDGIPAHTVTVLDGSSLDKSSSIPGVIDGIVTYDGLVGANWIINLTTGFTYPVQGSTTAPFLDLNSLNVSSSNGGSLDLQLSAKGFTAVGGATFIIDGTTDGTVDAKAYFSSSNDLLAETTEIAELGPFTDAFAGTTGGPVFGATPYSLTLDVNITHVGSATTNLESSSLAVVPEPGTLLLLGLGLIVFGVERKRELL